MTYTISCIQTATAIGFCSVTRRTPLSALEAAAEMAANGGIEVEIRDGRGDLRSFRQVKAEAEYGLEARTSIVDPI